MIVMLLDALDTALYVVYKLRMMPSYMLMMTRNQLKDAILGWLALPYNLLFMITS